MRHRICVRLNELLPSPTLAWEKEPEAADLLRRTSAFAENPVLRIPHTPPKKRASEIVMSAHAVLGPIDPQVGHFPAASILAVAERNPIADTDDETLR